MARRGNIAAAKESDRGLLRRCEPENICQATRTRHHAVVVPPSQRGPRSLRRVIVEESRLIELVIRVGPEHRGKGGIEDQSSHFRSEVTESSGSNRGVQPESL